MAWGENEEDKMPILDVPIVAVTVYVDRARVTRRGKFQLAAGEHTLTITNLPRSLEQDSVRAKGQGAGVKISGVDVQTQFISAAPEAQIAELEGQLQAIQNNDEQLTNESEVLAANL